MFTKKVRSTALAVSAVLLALVFGPQLPDRAHALPPALPSASQAGSGSATGTVLSHTSLTPAIVYATGDGHIHEIALKGTWQHRDLTAAAGAPVTYPAYSQPMAYRRSDGVSQVVYLGTDNHIHSLYLELRRQGSNWQEAWHWADLTTLSGAPLPMAGLSAYVRSDGISTINYTGYDGHIHDIRLETGWIWADLTAISGAPGTGYGPYSYVRGDGINAIVYATAGTDAGRVYELRLDNGWQYYELTSVSNAVRGYRPVGYVRADGISAVVYLGTDWHIHEIRLQTAWHWADLTYLAGAPAADGPPWPYNRSVVTRVHLPLVVRNR